MVNWRGLSRGGRAKSAEGGSDGGSLAALKGSDVSMERTASDTALEPMLTLV